jgi:hypothetical protein
MKERHFHILDPETLLCYKNRPALRNGVKGVFLWVKEGNLTCRRSDSTQKHL